MQLSKLTNRVKLATVVSAIVGVLWALWRRVNRDARLPPGSWGLPLLGEMLDFMKDPMEFIDKRHKRYGGTFKTHVLLAPCVFLRPTPENLKKFYTLRDVGWPSHWHDIAGHHSVTVVNGPVHKRMRTVCSRAFTQAQLDSYLPILDEYTRESLSKWAKVKEAVDMFMPIKVHTFDMMQRIIFGERFPDELSNHCAALFGETVKGMEVILPFHYPGSSWTRSVRARGDLMKIYQELIDKRRAAKEAGQQGTQNLIDALLGAKGDEGGEPSNIELQDTCLSMAMAGHETTLAIMQCLLHHLKAVPGMEDRLRAEVDAAWDGQAPITRAHFQKVPQCRAFIIEVLQITPALPALFRTPAKDIVVDGYRIPAGMRVAIGQGAIPKEFWGTAGQDFSIDRHIDEKGQYIERVYDTAAFGSFGGGSRMCIGYKLAMDELVVFVLLLLRAYEFQVEQAQYEPFPLTRWKVKVSFSERKS